MNLIDNFLNNFSQERKERKQRKNFKTKMFRKINSLFFDEKSRNFIKHLIISYNLKNVKKVTIKHKENDKLICALCKQKLSLTDRKIRAYTGKNTNTYLDYRCIIDLHDWKKSIHDFIWNKKLNVSEPIKLNVLAEKLKIALNENRT